MNKAFFHLERIIYQKKSGKQALMKIYLVIRCYGCKLTEYFYS